MDFSRLDGDPEVAAFINEVQGFLHANVTSDLRARVRADGGGLDPAFQRALGERGWIVPDWPVEEGGAGLDVDRQLILDSELIRADAPVMQVQSARMILPALQEFASDEIRDPIVAGTAAGDIAISQGYTEPDGGSDIAAVRTTATLDGDQWIINGAKMYTTGAHLCPYSFLIAATDPDAPRRQGLTMFLVPMDARGVDVRPLYTVGERTNSVYYDDVAVPDRYRVGPVNEGWRVLSAPLASEHGLVAGAAGRSPQDLSIMHTRRLALSLEVAMRWAERPSASGNRPIDNPAVRERLAMVSVAVEAASTAFGLRGRVASAQTFVDGASALVDLVGPASLVDDPNQPFADVGRWYGLSHLATVYGGTVEVFKNLLARELGLGSPRS